MPHISCPEFGNYISSSSLELEAPGSTCRSVEPVIVRLYVTGIEF